MVITHRKPNRLKNYDYSDNGWYFVTICVYKRQNMFGGIENKKMILNQYGQIVESRWLWLKKQYANFVDIDEYVIMPNHFHGIVIINSNVGNGRDRSLQVKIKSLSELIGAFKTTSSKLIHELGLNSFKWQKSFYDNIIRNEYSLFKIRKYIKDNPVCWETDRNNLRTIKQKFSN